MQLISTFKLHNYHINRLAVQNIYFSIALTSVQFFYFIQLNYFLGTFQSH